MKSVNILGLLVLVMLNSACQAPGTQFGYGGYPAGPGYYSRGYDGGYPAGPGYYGRGYGGYSAGPGYYDRGYRSQGRYGGDNQRPPPGFGRPDSRPPSSGRQPPLFGSDGQINPGGFRFGPGN